MTISTHQAAAESERPPTRPRPAHHRGQDRRSGAAAARGRARRLGAGGSQAARARQADRPGTDRAAARPGLVHRVRRAGQAPRHRLRDRGHPALRGRRGHRVRHRGRAPGLRVQPGFHRVRRLAGRGLRREDRQDHGSRAEDRLPDNRDQRRRRRPDPGRGGGARPVRRDLLPQRDGLRRHPADLADHGPVRGRRGLLPGHHRLHPHGGGDFPHVHHRPRRDQDGDRRGRDLRGARRRACARRQVRRRPLPGQRRAGLHRFRPRPAVLPALEQPGRAAQARRPGHGHHRTRRGRCGTRHAHPRLAEPAVRHARGDHPRARRRRVPGGTRRFRAEHGGRLRPGGRLVRRRGGQPADALRRLPRHRRRGEGGPVRPDLRRVQHPDPDVRRRAGIPARRDARNGAGSSAAAPSSSTPTRRPRCRR